MKELVFLSLILISSQSFGQSNDPSKFSINAKSGITFPVQGSYLKDNWQSAPYFGIDIVKKSYPIDLLIGVDYEKLSLVGDQIKFFSPHIGILQDFNFNKFILTSSLNLLVKLNLNRITVIQLV